MKSLVNFFLNLSILFYFIFKKIKARSECNSKSYMTSTLQKCLALDLSRLFLRTFKKKLLFTDFIYIFKSLKKSFSFNLLLKYLLFFSQFYTLYIVQFYKHTHAQRKFILKTKIKTFILKIHVIFCLKVIFLQFSQKQKTWMKKCERNYFCSFWIARG